MSRDHSGGRQRFVRVVVYVIVLLTVIGMVASMASTALAAPAPASAPGGTANRTDAQQGDPAPVVIIGTTGWSWAQVASRLEESATDSQHRAAQLLAALATDGEPANLVQRTAGATTCPADAWLSLSAGARTRAVTEIDDPSACRWPAAWGRARLASASAGYAATPGLLADTLDSQGLTATAVGPGAVLALTASHGRGPATAASLEEAVNRGLSDLTIVDTAPSPTGSGAEDPASPLLAALDTIPSLPEGTRVIIVSVADPVHGGPQAVILPSGSRGAEAGAASNGARGSLLIGPSTHQRGLIQLTDLAPTALEALGADAPSQMTGQALALPNPAPATETGGNNETGGASTALPQSITTLADDALRARASQMTTLPATLFLVASSLGLLVVASQVLRGPSGRRYLHRLGLAATTVAALPIGAWLAALVPWWRAGARGDTPSWWGVIAALTVTVLITIAVVGALHALSRVAIRLRGERLAPSRRRRGDGARAGSGAGPGTGPDAVEQSESVTIGELTLPSSHRIPTALALSSALIGPLVAGVILFDGASGAPLGFNGALGMNAVVAGRFYGLSNTAFALAAAALIVGIATITTQMVAVQPNGRLRRRATYAVILAVGAPALVAVGAPRLGADVGGAFTLVASLVALAATLTGHRIGWKQWLGAAVMAASAAGLFGLIDYATGSTTHMGRFVGQLQNGTAASTIQRKTEALVAPFLSSALALIGLVAGLTVIAVIAWWVHREVLAWRAGCSGYAPLVEPQVPSAFPTPSTAPTSQEAVLGPTAGQEEGPRIGKAQEERIPPHDGIADEAAAGGTEETPSAGVPSRPWVGTVPEGAQLLPSWCMPSLKALTVLMVVEVLVNDSGASMAWLSATAAAPILLATAAARLDAAPCSR